MTLLIYFLEICLLSFIPAPFNEKHAWISTKMKFIDTNKEPWTLTLTILLIVLYQAHI